jgi:ribonuclease-3 family protein
MTDYLNLSLSDEQLRGISVLGLAHMGDCVYEILVRTWLCAHGRVTGRGLHHDTVAYVSATAQAGAMEKLLPILTDEETQVFKRGRNARVNSIPRNADVSKYHTATGLEALFGWLWLKGRRERINELFATVMEE